MAKIIIAGDFVKTCVNNGKYEENCSEIKHGTEIADYCIVNKRYMS